MVRGDYCDFPYENIGFDTPYVEGGVLMCFMFFPPGRSSDFYPVFPGGHWPPTLGLSSAHVVTLNGGVLA